MDRLLALVLLLQLIDEFMNLLNEDVSEVILQIFMISSQKFTSIDWL